MMKLGIDLGTPAFDHLLHMNPLGTACCSDDDVRTVLGAFNVAELRRLDGAFRRGLVVRRIFTAGGGKGCLLYHLNNAIVSFGAQSAYFAKNQDAFRASQQLVAAWDSDALSEEKVRVLLAEAIRVRGGRPRDPWHARLTEGLEARRRPDQSPNRGDQREERRPAERAKPANRFRPTAEKAAPVAVLE
jgi:hypothetical protein